jgi:hypothetical protein
MMLAQATDMTEGLARLKEGFNREGDPTMLVIIVLILLVPLVLLAVIRSFQKRTQRPETDDPGQLFGELLRDAGFLPRERRLLERIAAELHLAQPVTLLLSPVLFREQAQAWQAQVVPAAAPAEEELASIERRLGVRRLDE